MLLSQKSLKMINVEPFEPYWRIPIIKIGFRNAFAHYLIMDRFCRKIILNCGSNDLNFNPLMLGGHKKTART